MFITDRVRSTTGRLCFDSCLSFCLSTPGGYPDGGWYPTSGTPVRPGRGYPPSDLAGGGYPSLFQPDSTLGTLQSDLARGYPTLGTPQTWPEGTLMGMYPPPSDLAGGVPQQGVPHLRYPPSDLAGGYPDMGYPTLVVLDTPRSVCLLRSRRTF